MYILSNYGKNMLNHTEDKLKFLCRGRGCFSYKIKKIKVYQNICEVSCDEYWLEPEEKRIY